jgi:threonine dehydratase
MSAEGPVAALTADVFSEAQQRVAPHVHRTPMLSSATLSHETGYDVRLKAELFQRTGSYKIRGPSNKLPQLSPEQQRAGVICSSAGNHAQGVALAAAQLGIPAVVVMASNATPSKIAATKAYGAEVVLHGLIWDEANAEAERIAAERGLTMVHPFDDVQLIAGQGTVGLEILEQAPGVETVVVPTGGGGLLAGIAIAVKAKRPGVRVIGVQAEGAAAYPPSLAAGYPCALETMTTMADGIAVGLPGEVTFKAVSELVDEVITVSEASLSRAVLATLERAKQVIEPAGAAAVAAILDDPARFSTPTVGVLSGGNIDPLLLGKVIQHGMAAAGRYLNLRLRIPDRPGGLAELLTELGAAGANVIEVSHARIDADLSLDEVEVRLQLETRGESHAELVLARLRECGYRIFE